MAGHQTAEGLKPQQIEWNGVHLVAVETWIRSSFSGPFKLDLIHKKLVQVEKENIMPAQTARNGFQYSPSVADLKQRHALPDEEPEDDEQPAPRYAMPLSKYGFFGSAAHGPELRERYGDLIDAQVSDLEEILQAVETKLRDEIDRSNKLTPAGKMEARQELGKTAYAQIEKAVKRRQMMSVDHEKAQNNFPTHLQAPALSPSETAEVREMRAREIREFLLKLDPLLRGPALLSSASVGDVSVLLAVKNAPRFMQIVSPDQIAAATDAFFRTHHAAQYSAVETAAAGLRAFNQNIAAAQKLVSKMTRYAPPVEPEFVQT